MLNNFLNKIFFILQPPSPIQPWKDILNCTKDAPLPICPSLDKESLNSVTGSEDCLYLEVSTPDIKPEEPMPVMFWIGSYSFAYYIDNISSLSVLANDHNVVLVKCGFRLGPFGFLSINDYVAPGNCGLKDLVMALKWVQRNISIFGGDPNNITILGDASGGAIVHFMMLSPMATGLFHKAIIKSASALNNWACTKNPCQPVMELAKHLNIKTTSAVEIVDELRSMSAYDIMGAFKKMSLEIRNGVNNDVIDTVFKPCIEIEFEGQPAFLTKSPVLLMNSGNFHKVPLMIGSNNIADANLKLMNKDTVNFDKINDNVCLLVPRSLAAEDKLSKNIGYQLLKFYLGGDARLTNDTTAQYLQLISDYYFSYYVNKSVRIHTEAAPEIPIYYFIVNRAPEWAMPKDVNFSGALEQSDKFPIVFRIEMPQNGKHCRDLEITRRKVLKMWTNFAKFG